MSGTQESDMPPRPSYPSSGLAGPSTSYSTQSQAQNSGLRPGLTWKERLLLQSLKAQQESEEGLHISADWDVQHDEALEPTTGSRSLPVREAPPPHQEDLSVTDLEDNISEGGSEHGELSFNPLGKEEYALLLPMVPTVRDIYNLEINKHQETAHRLVTGEGQMTKKGLKEMDELIANLKLLGDHQDLFAGPADSQENLTDEIICKWALNCSPKCFFLEKLFEGLRTHRINVAVLARSGLTLDILSSLLEVKKISHTRPDINKVSIFDCDLTVTLLPTGFADGRYIVSPVNAVIAFDSTFFAGEVYSKGLREHDFNPDIVAPLIVLATEFSAEHVEMCLPKSMDPEKRKALLVKATCDKRKEVGLNTLPRPENAAPPIAAYLTDCATSESLPRPKWPLEQNLSIDDIDVSEEFTGEQSGSSTQAHSQLHPDTIHPPLTNKRAREIAEDENSKRLRMTPEYEMVPGSSEEVSHVSDSAGHPTQPNPATHWTFAQVIVDRRERDAVHEQQTAGMWATIKDLQDQLQARSASDARVSELEAQLRMKDDINAALSKRLGLSENKVEEQVSLIKRFEPAWREAQSKRGEAERALGESEARATTLANRLEGRSIDINTLKLTINETQEQLKERDDRLAHSIIPEVRELEEMRRRLEAAEEEKQKAEKRYQSVTQDFEFTKEQYQQASSTAASFGREVEDLRKQNMELQMKADGNRVKIQQIHEASAQEQLVDRIEELKAEVEDLKHQLLTKAEELRKRGDRALRGASAPRSPIAGPGQLGGRSGNQTPVDGSRWTGAS